MRSPGNGVNVRIKRVYLPPDLSDGRRVLVDRLWPRGVTREAAAVEDWFREIGPSNELRTWFGHQPDRWDEFRTRYLDELASPPAAPLLDRLKEMASAGVLTLVYSAKDEARNQAVVIAQALANI